MNLKKTHTLLVVAGLLALVGCNEIAPTEQPESATTLTDTAPAIVATACPEQTTGYNAFPGGMSLAAPYHLRGDRIYTHKNGQERRRVTVEFLEGDAGTALAAFGQSMTNAGFKAHPRKDGPDGKLTTAFTKKGFGTAHVTAIPTPGPKPSNPAAKGLISIDYPMPGDTAVAAAPATTS